MATGTISKRTVDALPTTGRTEFLWDDTLRGFGVRVTANGAKSYVYQYRTGGREAPKRRYTIGRHGSPWTPSLARAEAERLSLLVAQGIDPVEAENNRRRQAVDLAFRSYGDRFLSLYVKSEWAKSYAFAEGALRLHAYPVLGMKPLPSITRSDIAALLDRLAGRTALRRNVYAVLRRLFRWAVSRGDIERTPLEGMETPSSPDARDRVLSDAELALAWQGTQSLGYPFGPLFRLLMATGQRREEVGGLEWAELDQSTLTWTLPAERAKNGQTHIVPLNALAVAELDGLSLPANCKPPKWPKGGLVFTTTGKTPVSGHSRAKSRWDAEVAKIELKQAENAGRMRMVIKPWRLHDLRRTTATGLQRLGVRFEVTEAILNHVSGSRSGVAGVYQRHDWKEEKRAALDAWSAHVSQLIMDADPTNEPSIGTAGTAS